MLSIDKTVVKETKHIAFVVSILSVLMNVMFLVFRKWNYTVLLGTIYSSTIAIVNFLLMGITVQKALSKEENDARKVIKVSQSLRNLGMFVLLGIGIVLPCFDTIALIIPVFFPRIAVFMRVIKRRTKRRSDR